MLVLKRDFFSRKVLLDIEKYDEGAVEKLAHI